MLGKEVKCLITGFKGIATAKVEYINGCVQFCVKPKSENGKMPVGEYIDIQQLIEIGDGVLINSESKGGDRKEHPKKTY